MDKRRKWRKTSEKSKTKHTKRALINYILMSGHHLVHQSHCNPLNYLIGHNNSITDFSLLQYILPGASASWAPKPVGYTKRWQGFLDLVFPTDASLSFSPTFADPRIKYPSRWSILLHTKGNTRLRIIIDIIFGFAKEESKRRPSCLLI